MFGVHAEVAARPITVACENGASLVPSLGFAADGKRQLQQQDYQQRTYCASEQAASKVVRCGYYWTRQHTQGWTMLSIRGERKECTGRALACVLMAEGQT